MIITDSLTQGHLDSKRFVLNFQKILEILEEFKNNYTKRLNFSKIAKILDLSPSEGDQVISLLLQSQDLFNHIFRNYQLKKHIENNHIYLLAKPKRSPLYQVLTSAQIELMNDIIYTFKNVKRGQGFAVKANGSVLIKKIMNLQAEHPYLFEKKENGLIYPSKIGFQLGEFILACTRSNKALKKIPIENYIFMVDADE